MRKTDKRLFDYVWRGIHTLFIQRLAKEELEI
jgi:hypothetical protein